MSCGCIFPLLIPAVFISPVSRIEKIQSTILFIYVEFSTVQSILKKIAYGWSDKETIRSAKIILKEFILVKRNRRSTAKKK
jgi:hypothetical protein